MAADRKETPDFFEDKSLDPVEAATGYPKKRGQSASKRSFASEIDKSSSAKPNAGYSTQKKKAGFYISADILERFTHKFYELKLAGVAIENKSNLLELALAFALDDMDKGTESRVLQRLNT
jgi:hypothetical protein